MFRTITLTLVAAIAVALVPDANADNVFGSRRDDDLVINGESGEPKAEQLTNGDPNQRPDDELEPIYQFTGTYFLGQPFTDPTYRVYLGGGADTLTINTYISAKLGTVIDHTNDDGTIDWAGVAGTNTYVHEHWVDTFGFVDILDFNADEDTIALDGHTTVVGSVEQIGDDSLITVISQQGDGGGAHDEDVLGQILVRNAEINAADIQTNAGSTQGIVDTIDEFIDLADYYDSLFMYMDPYNGFTVTRDGFLWFSRPNGPFANLDPRLRSFLSWFMF